MKTKRLFCTIIIIIVMLAAFAVCSYAQECYTVDFEYNGICKKILGDSKNVDFQLLISELGIDDEIEDIRIFDENLDYEYIDDEVVINNRKLFDVVNINNQWVFNSYNSFENTFYIVVNTNVDSYTIKLTDPVAEVHNIKIDEVYEYSYDLGIDEHVSSDEVDGNMWFFDTTQPSKLKASNFTYDNNSIQMQLTGRSLAEGIQVSYKKYDGEKQEWVPCTQNEYYNVIAPSAELDLVNNTLEVYQKYDLEVVTELTDVTRVKISWVISNIEVTRTEDKIWDSINLVWVDDKSDTAINTNGTAEFTFENYSSVKIDATVEFESEGDFNPSLSFDEKTGIDGKVTIDTANGNSEYNVNNVPTEVITATITPNNDDFAKIEKASSNCIYGTYTITIEQTPIE